MHETDVIVLGVGTCGEDAALRLLASGLEVVGIEARLLGGECPYFACLPSKSMLRSASLLQGARRADGLIGKVDVAPDWGLVAERVRAEITGGWDDAGAVARFEGRGGHFVRGRGVLTGPRTVDVDGHSFEARRGIIIATGSVPSVPSIPGLAEAGYWDTRDAIRADALPASLLVLGGGAIGCELGQVFARFGAHVTIVEAQDRLLPHEESVASETLTEAFVDEGIDVITGAAVRSVRGDGPELTAELSDGTALQVERVLVASGRTLDLGSLGLETAGVEVRDGAVAVDGHLRAAPGIWAIGDVTGIGMYTHVALYQGSIAIQDILGGNPVPADYSVLPRTVLTDPEVGSVGLTEDEARRAGLDVAVTVKQLGSTFRGWLHRTGNAGVMKFVVDRASGKLVGAAVVGPCGAEVLGMLAIAMKAGMRAEELTNMIYAFPTFYGGVGEALGAYGRGLVTVLDPGSTPMFTDRELDDG